MLALGKRDVPLAAKGRKIELQIAHHAGDGFTEDLVIAAEPDAAFDGEAARDDAFLIALEVLFVLHVHVGRLADANTPNDRMSQSLCVV